MNTRPISPKVHSVIDYCFAAGLFVLSKLFKVNDTDRKMYSKFAKSIVVYTGITDQPLSAKRIIPFKVHGFVDHVSLAGLVAMLFLRKSFRTDKSALAIQIGFVALGALNVFLTNWKAGVDEEWAWRKWAKR